ncbi:serine/threonine-protein kinase nek11 [Anaeramoeba ignava]|uniref:Serine/threonine-protein kinase nek11 n=1 Tax=Anaeramoeba ignava TaxID=1746090 RepID=A0A9Q0LW79_ANAIG|nr:serine/threonine-protein kinase nek11 [Anaeramoeba ignava]
MENKSFTCPICFEEYSQERKPMIACAAGHTICELCLKNMKECPFCRSSLTKFKPIQNRILLEIIEQMKEQKKVANVPIIPLSELKIEPKPFAYGSSADIYKAKWGTNQVVLKKIRIQTDQKLKNQFENELQVAIKLIHPNIIRIYGMFESNFEFGILMEFAEQGNLEQKIPNLTFQEQINYSLKIIDGIKYLHLNSIIHRDLKPQNILISNDQPKISDFGLSKIHEHTMKVTSVTLSLLYSAPELFQQGNNYDSSCDIFSLSMILFQMFSKKQPFQNENAMMVSMKIMQGTRPEFPNDFPKELIEVIKKGWSQDPKERCSLDEFIQFFVRNMKGKTIAIDVNQDDSVESLVEKVHESEGTPVTEIRLIYKGKQLQPEKKLKDYNISHGTKMDMVLRNQG